MSQEELNGHNTPKSRSVERRSASSRHSITISPERRGKSSTPASFRSKSKSIEPPRKDRKYHRSRERSPPQKRTRERSRSPRRGGRPKYDDGRNNPEPSPILGVFGMSHRTTSRDLDHIFGKYGRIDQINIMKDRVTGDSRGFGFIYFSNVNSATRARDELNGKEIHGRNIRTDYSITKQGHSQAPKSFGGYGRSGGYGREERHDRSERYGRQDRSFQRERPDRRRGDRYYDRSRSRR